MKKQDKKNNKTNADKGKQHETPSPIRKYRIHLRNYEDVRRLLSSTINELRENTIDSTRAGKIIYAAGTLMNCLEMVTMEARLTALEELVKTRKS